VVNTSQTGEPYTNGEEARVSAGGLTEEDVKGIRSGKIADPFGGQVAAAKEDIDVHSSDTALGDPSAGFGEWAVKWKPPP
jgi:hypothetical protein